MNDFMIPVTQLALTPLYLAAAGAMIVLLIEATWQNFSRKWIPGAVFILLLALIACNVITLDLLHESAALFSGTVFVDRFALIMMLSATLAALIGSHFATAHMRENQALTGEFYALLLFALSGAYVLILASEMLTLFVGLELLSISVYAMAGYFRIRENAAEAAMKYLLQGIFASAFLFLGIALLYGATGTTQLDRMSEALAKSSSSLLPLLALLLLVAGLGFKVALVPFHGWAADVYDGAPAAITAFLATGVKAAAFAAFARILLAMSHTSLQLMPLFIALAVLTMTVGNLSAFMQRSVKRMLAFSSVAHAGYVMVAFSGIGSSPSQEIYGAVALYLFAYTLMTGGLFALISWWSGSLDLLHDIEDFRGLGRRHPFVAIVLAILLFSLTGLPPTAGFFGKYAVIRLAVSGGFYWLAVIVVLNSFLSAYYYLRVVVYSFMESSDDKERLAKRSEFSVSSLTLLGIAGLLTLVAGFFMAWFY